MSYQIYFSLSSGLATPLRVPKGIKASWVQHVEEVEKALGLTRVKYLDNPVHWDSFKRDFSKLDDKLVCETVAAHNDWVRECYEQLEHWSKHPFKVGRGHQAAGVDRAWPIGWEAEDLTPKDAEEFWHGFEMLTVVPEKWTREYFVGRMEHLYEVMRGRPSEGVSLDAKALTPKQAAGVIRLFDTYLDGHDCRLDAPKWCDYLASSYDGGYDWCGKCGAVTPDDGARCGKRKCPLRAERGDEA